jgi:hypothetical protein
MEEKLNNIEQKVDRIEKALLGDGFGNEGYMQRLQDIEKHVEENKQRMWTERGIIISLSAIWALVVKFWDNIFS